MWQHWTRVNSQSPGILKDLEEKVKKKNIQLWQLEQMSFFLFGGFWFGFCPGWLAGSLYSFPGAAIEQNTTEWVV